MQIKNQIAKNSHVVWSISIGQSEQTGVYVNQMAQIILEHKKCIVKITLFKADTLQRIRYMLRDNLNEQDALALSKKYSEEWTAENAKAIAELEEKLKESGILFQVKTWDDYRLLDDFSNILEKIQALYNSDHDFKHAVDGLATNFSNKLKTEMTSDSYNYKKSFDLHKKYILEECTVLILMTKDETEAYNCELYKGVRNRAMDCVYKKMATPGRMIANAFIKKKLIQISDNNTSSFFTEKREAPTAPISITINAPKKGMNISVSVQTNTIDDDAINTISRILRSIGEAQKDKKEAQTPKVEVQDEAQKIVPSFNS